MNDWQLIGYNQSEHQMNDTTEISPPTSTTDVEQSFSKRLREALETLEEGQHITLRTKEDRQTITNVVLALKKRTGRLLTTKLVQRRDDEGKIIIRIKRLEDPVV